GEEFPVAPGQVLTNRSSEYGVVFAGNRFVNRSTVKTNEVPPAALYGVTVAFARTGLPVEVFETSDAEAADGLGVIACPVSPQLIRGPVARTTTIPITASCRGIFHPR